MYSADEDIPVILDIRLASQMVTLVLKQTEQKLKSVFSLLILAPNKII